MHGWCMTKRPVEAVLQLVQAGRGISAWSILVWEHLGLEDADANRRQLALVNQTCESNL
jgi:hypothetical protein